MTDTIKALNEVLNIAAKRVDGGNGEWGSQEEDSEGRLGLLEEIVTVAGDALEDHVKASNKAKPRKQRVYKEIVEKIAAYFCDQCDTAEGSYHTEEAIREILASYDVETVDFTGRTVKIV